MKRHKVILYNPKAVFYTMPLALLAIGSSLDPRKYEVIIIDGRLEKEPVKRVLSQVDDALCLGVTALTGNPIRDGLHLTRAAKSRRTDLPVVWGGWHASLFPIQTLHDEPCIDFTVQGQGEITFRELVERLTNRDELKNLPGISYRDNGEVVQNPPRAIMDMNKLPPLNYDLIPVERYFRLKGKSQFDYISSTGCFFRCAFCADPFVYNRKWTALEPERMGEELKYHKSRYHFGDIDFQDETFFTYRKRVVSIAEQFLERNMDTTWAATMRADQGTRLNDDDFALCAKSGLLRVLIGVESGSQEMMDWMQKDIKLEQVLNCADRCLRHNIAAIFPFIVGFPGENDTTVKASMDLIKKLRSMHPKFDTPLFYFKPYPGSNITRNVVNQGYQLPQTIHEWADFDYIGTSGPWVSREKYRLIERFKFYSRIAWGRPYWLYTLLRKLAQWRCKHDFYQLPLEKKLVEWLKPLPKLS